MKFLAEVGDVMAATDEVNRSKASAEKSYRNLFNNLNDLNKKVEEANLHLGDLEALKCRLTVKNAGVLRQLQELKNNEAKDRQLLLSKYRNLKHKVDVAREALEEEATGREDVLRLNGKAEGDTAAMRQKYEQEAIDKAKEFEMTKMKLAARTPTPKLPLITVMPSSPRLRRPRARSRRTSMRCPPT